MPHDVATRTAQEIVDKHFEAFSKKHYEKILERLEIEEEALKGAMEVIQRLNPRPAIPRGKPTSRCRRSFPISSSTRSTASWSCS
jgi:RNA polymerase sigma-54 factor